jgi:hypothetical protein
VNPRAPEPHRTSADEVRLQLSGATVGRLRFTAGAQDVDLVAD